LISTLHNRASHIPEGLMLSENSTPTIWERRKMAIERGFPLVGGETGSQERHKT
jgi:hypothetical protein